VDAALHVHAEHLHKKSLPWLQQVCGRQVGRHRLTCLADTIKLSTPFQWQ